MSKKTLALLTLGFVGTFLVGMLIGALSIRTFFNPTLTLKADKTFDKDKVVLERVFSIGAVIMEVLEDSPAEVAGLAVGDVILHVNDEEVGKDGTLADIIRSQDIGDDIELLIVREGEKQSHDLTLGEHPEDEDMPFHNPEFEFDMMGGPGLVVMHVAEGSPAEEGGLLPTDIIIAIDGTEIAHFDQFAGIIRSYEPGDGITLSVFRDGEELELNITLGEHPEEKGRAYLGVMGIGIHEFMPDNLRPGLNFENQG